MTLTADGNVLTTVDPRNVETQYKYDAEGDRTSEIDAVGTAVQQTTTASYDDDGNVLTTLEPGNVETTYA